MPELAPDPTSLSRIELLQLAQSLGVSDADVMTRAELRTAIDKARRPEPPSADPHPITWVSVARRLLASVVERGLNLPDAASLIRGDTKFNTPPKAPPPVATVTLARIYGAQGHIDRAIGTLDEVLESDPDHELARDLRSQLQLRRADLLARGASTGPSYPPPRANGRATPPASPEAESPASGVHPSPTSEAFEAPPHAGSEPLAVAPLADPVPFARPPEPADAAAAMDAPASVQPPPFVDAPAFLEPQPFTAGVPVDAEPLSEPAPSVQPPPFVDAPSAALGAWPTEPDRFAGEALAVEPPPFVYADPPSADAEATDRHEAITSLPPAIHLDADSPDPSAEPIAPAIDALERDIRATEAVAEPAAALASSTERPTMAGSVALDRDTPAHPGIELETEPPPTIASEVELPPGPALAARSEPEAPSSPESGLTAASAQPHHAPNGTANGALAAAAPVAALPGEPANGAHPSLTTPLEPSLPLPHVPGLVLIETDTRVRYVYWELAASGLGAPHWIHVVTHTPTSRGDTERHERHFPVHRALGALRLEGVPAHAVVRARLTHANDTRPLVVAGAVRPRAPGAEPFEIRYTPHPSAKPEALASRAQALLERASPVYWDNV